MKLDLACGRNKRPGFKGVDMISIPGHVDVVWNLNVYPWPFAQFESVSHINCAHFLEHVEDIIKFMNECYRIMKNGARMDIVCPYYTSIRAWQDPTHVRAITQDTFLYFNKSWRREHGLDHYNITTDFNYEFAFHLNDEWKEKAEEEKIFAIKHYFNVVDDIHVVLFKN